MTDCDCRCHVNIYNPCDLPGGCASNHAPEKPKACFYDKDKGRRFVKTEHRTECQAKACKGCVPCEQDHCRVCGWRHPDDAHPLTCPECVGETRDDLDEIAELSSPSRVMGEAINRGINSAAAFIAGPAAHPAAFARRRRWVTLGGLCSCEDGTCPDEAEPPQGPVCEECSHTVPAEHKSCGWIIGPRCPAMREWLGTNRDENHPEWVLGLWDHEVAIHLGHDREYARSTDYLQQHLTALAQDEDFGFDEFARSIRSCRHYLEEIQHDGDQVERGAPCWICNTGVLVEKCHAEMTDEKGELLVDGEGRQMEDDYWYCPACESTWDIAQYDSIVTASSIFHATELTVAGLALRLSLPESTIRRWAAKTKTQRVGHAPVEHPPLIRPCGRSSDGRKLYRIEDVAAVAREKGRIPA